MNIKGKNKMHLKIQKTKKKIQQIYKNIDNVI